MDVRQIRFTGSGRDAPCLEIQHYAAFYVPIIKESPFYPQGREQKVDSNQEPFTHPAPEQIPKTFVEAVNVLRPSAIIGK